MMKAVALATGYRPGIDQECIKKWRINIACSVVRANALNVQLNVHDCGHQAYLGCSLAIGTVPYWYLVLCEVEPQYSRSISANKLIGNIGRCYHNSK